MAPFIDAVILKGQTRSFTVSIQIRDETSQNFIPFDLTPYSIKFKVMGAPTADAAILVEHLITQISSIEDNGKITNPANGQFTFTITAEDTKVLGLGKRPIMMDVINTESGELAFTLGEGGSKGEFNKIFITQI